MSKQFVRGLALTFSSALCLVSGVSLAARPAQPPGSGQRCMLSRSDKRPKSIIIMYEGHNGYTDALSGAFSLFQLRKPRCIGNRVYFSDGSSSDLYDVIGQLHRLVPADLGSPVGLKAMILRGACKGAGLDFKDTEVFYFPETQDISAPIECIEKFAGISYGNDRSGRALYPSLMVLGYSNGGARAIELGKELGRRGIRVELGLTVDPVPRGVDGGLLIAAQALGQADSRTAKLSVPAAISWDNYWQESDNRFEDPAHLAASGERHRGLHGNRVAGSFNQLIVPPPAEAGAYPNGGHWRIFDSPIVEKGIANDLKRAFDKGREKTQWRIP